MVNLPVFDLGIGRRRRHQIPRVPRPPRNHHQWGTSKGPYVYGEPTGLQDLEVLAQRSVAVMEKHGTKSEHNYHRAMDLLRLQYNMNFLMLCDICRGTHSHDEILAPER